VAGFLLLHQQ